MFTKTYENSVRKLNMFTRVWVVCTIFFGRVYYNSGRFYYLSRYFYYKVGRAYYDSEWFYYDSVTVSGFLCKF
jgi:hypothetical protein